MPKVFYALHMGEGVAQYNDDGETYCIYIGNDTLKKMNASFSGKPVYVHHVEEEDLSKVELESAGYVVKSFYNEADGKFWDEIIIVSDEGHKAIADGWKVSNAYNVTETGPAGQWHGVDYKYEVIGGEYAHLALTPEPRYRESIILSPEQFKAYNDEKKKLHNSDSKKSRIKNGAKAMFDLFKKTKVENSADYNDLVVTLPNSGVQVELVKLVNEADRAEMDKDKPQNAGSDMVVEVLDEKMTVNELKCKYEEMMENKRKNEEEEEEKKENKRKNEEEKKENGEEDAEEAIDDVEEELEELEEIEEEKQNKKKKKNSNGEREASDEEGHFNKLKNASNQTPDQNVELMSYQVNRGKSRYGSK
tara:strand:- start:30023 stop:31108 length:1086 start_codon:yes stop_codon:yes gene_type:complete